MGTLQECTDGDLFAYLAQRDVIRVTIDPSKRAAESNTVPPDVPGNYITFRFDGPEATKNRTMFFLTLESEIKKNKETRGKKDGE